MKAAPPLWILRTAFRTVGTFAPDVAARWAETIFCRPPSNEARPSEEAFLERTISFLEEGLSR